MEKRNFQMNSKTDENKQSGEQWCYDPIVAATKTLRILKNAQTTHYEHLIKFFDQTSNIYLQCIEKYYDFKNKQIDPTNIEYLNQFDLQRITKLLEDERENVVLVEFFLYNWKLIKDTNLREKIIETVGEFAAQKSPIFNVFTFSQIVLLQFGDDTITKYCLKTVFSHITKNSLFLHSGTEEWNYLLGYFDYFTDSISEAEQYKDFKLKGWLKALLIYLSIKPTYYDKRIVSILKTLFFNPQLEVKERINIFCVVCVLIDKKIGYLEDFKTIYEFILDYQYFLYVKNITVGETQANNYFVLLQPIHYFINSFPHFVKLELQSQYYKFFSELTDEFYKKELFKKVLKHANLIPNPKDFVNEFPFFEELILDFLRKENVKKLNFVEINPVFCSFCVSRICNFYFKANKYTDNDWELLYNILLKCNNILNVIASESTQNSFYSIKEVSEFILFLYYDISYYFSIKQKTKIFDLFKRIQMNLLRIFFSSGVKLDEKCDLELFTYSNIIQQYFLEDKKYSEMFNHVNEALILLIIDRHSIFCSKFGYHSIYFLDFLEIIHRINKVSVVLYRKIILLISLKQMEKELLELCIILLDKVELNHREFASNYIFKLGWVDILDGVTDLDALDLKKTLVKRLIIFIYSNRYSFLSHEYPIILKTCQKNNIDLHSIKQDFKDQTANPNAIKSNYFGEKRQNFGYLDTRVPNRGSVQIRKAVYNPYNFTNNLYNLYSKSSIPKKNETKYDIKDEYSKIQRSMKDFE